MDLVPKAAPTVCGTLVSNLCGVRERSRRRPRGKQGKGREALTCCEGIVARGMFCLVQEAGGVNRCMRVRVRACAVAEFRQELEGDVTCLRS
jgi:hypothetical protein